MQWLQVLLSSILLTYIQSLSDIKYSNQWSVQIDGGKEEADRLAKKHGFVNEGKVSCIKLELVLSELCIKKIF